MDGWPLFELHVGTPSLWLRPLDDSCLAWLADQACGNILRPDQRHYYASDWPLLPAPEFQRSMLQFHWRCRAELRPGHWHLCLGIFPSDHECPVGQMELIADGFTRGGVLDTGSWLLGEWQGRGLGRQARRLALELAFAHLGAEQVRSQAAVDNLRSCRISQSLGYRQTPHPDNPQRHYYLLDRATWQSQPRPEVEVRGLEECLPLLLEDS